MADTIESLIARLGLDYSEFKEGMVKSGEAVSKLNESMENMQKGIAGAAIGEFVKSQTEAAAATVNFAKNLDINTDSLQAFYLLAKENSGTVQEVNTVFTHTKKALDELRAGSDAAREKFAALGLAVENFEGLNFDQALELIAKSYSENETHAGAYAALQEIVGRTGRNLTTTLTELGEQGLAPLVQHFKDTHEIISNGTLNDLAQTHLEIEALTNNVKVFSAEALGALNKLVSGTSGALAEYVTKTEQAHGFWAKTAAILSGLVNPQQLLLDAVTDMAEKDAATADAAEKAKKSHEGDHDVLVATKAVQESRTKLEEALGKSAEQGLSLHEKLAQIDKELEASSVRAAEAETDEVKRNTEFAKQAQLRGEYAKVEKEWIEQSLAIDLKRLEQRRAELPLYQQRAVLVAENEFALATIADLESKGYDTAKARAESDKIRHELHRLDVKLAEDDLKTSADLLSTDKGRVEQAKIHWQLTHDQVTAAGVMSELYGLIGKGATNLTEQEQLRAKALFDNLEPLQQQQVLENEIRSDVEYRTDAEKDLLAVLLGQLDTLKKQHAEKQATIDLGMAKALGGRQFYDDPNQQAAYDQQLLQSAREQIARDMAAIQKTISTYERGGAASGQFELPALRARLAVLEARSQHVDSYVFDPNYSDALGGGLFHDQVASIGDPLGLQKKSTDTLAAVATGVTQLNQRLEANGFSQHG